MKKAPSAKQVEWRDREQEVVSPAGASPSWQSPGAKPKPVGPDDQTG